MALKKFIAVFGVAAVYAEEAAPAAEKAAASPDADDEDFDKMTDDGEGAAGSPGMEGMGGPGGPEGEMPDMEAMFKLDTSCKAPKECKADEKFLPKALSADREQYIAYGCTSSPMMAQMMGKDTDAKSPAEDCCVARDIAMQMCGKSKAEIEETFEKCLVAKCDADQDCPFQAKMGPVMEQMMGGPEGACKSYNDGQTEGCECVAADKFDAELKNYVDQFNKVVKPETEYKVEDIEEGKHMEFIMKMILDNKEKAIKMDQKADPFAGMGDMGMPEGGEEGGEEAGSTGELSDTEEDAEEDTKEDKKEEKNEEL